MGTLCFLVGSLWLGTLSFSTGTGYAALNPTLSAPLITLGTLPPEEADGPFQNWKNRNKYFLVVGVTETGLPDTALPFTQVDATAIATALTERGYQPLITDQPILTGNAATRSAIIKAVKTSHQGKYEDDIIAIYFTGHASVGTNDLWLQTYGQEELGEGQGIALAELVTRTRFKEGHAAFEGELVIIIDTCFSGQGTLSQSLTLGELGRHTTIFSGSTSTQASFPLNAPDLPKMSAFTYSLLQAMGPQWEHADWDGDGMLRFAEIQIFSKNLLRAFWQTKKVDALMEPELFNANQEQFLAYRRDKVRALHTPYRIALQTEEVNKALAAHLQTLGPNPKAKPKVPQKAQALAKGLQPAPDDYYSQSIQATAEGRLDDARALFVKADQQSRAREQEEEAKRQQALQHQQEAQAAKQAEQKKRYDLYLARARMEAYDGKFTDAFSWYLQAANLRPPSELDLINEIGLAGLRAGNYPEAEPYLRHALEQREKELDPDHPDIGISLNSLARLNHAQGKYAEAEPLFLRALRLTEAALGPDHPIVGIHLNNLAGLYLAQGKYAEAEPLMHRALRLTEAAFGPDHPKVGIRLNNLAELFRTQGKYTDAEPLMHRSLRLTETAFGPNHPHVAIALNNLAELFRTQGKYTDAEPLFHRVLQIDETALGPHHPDVAIDLNNLAGLYLTQGKYAEAEPLMHRALRLTEAALGPDHPKVGIRLNNLALLYKKQGKYAEAEPLFHRALKIDEAALGANHPDVAIDLNNLAVLYKVQGRYAEAEPLYHRALKIDEAALGPNHPTVGMRLNNLARLYQDQGKYADAEPLFQHSFWILLKRLGPDHPTVATIFNNYQAFLKTSGQASDPETVIRKLQAAQAIDAKSPSTPVP